MDRSPFDLSSVLKRLHSLDENDGEESCSLSDISPNRKIESKDVSDFLGIFNRKYGASCNTMVDVTKFLESHYILSKSDVSSLKQKCTKCKADLKSQKEKIQLLQQNNTSLNEEITKIRAKSDEASIHGHKEAENGQRKLSSIESAFLELHGLLQTSADEKIALFEQRNKLISIINRQSNLISVYESQPTYEPNAEDFYSLLAGLYQMASDALPSTVLKNYTSIKDASELSPSDRVQRMFQTLLVEFQSVSTKLQSTERLNEKLACDAKVSERRASHAFSVLHEELGLLQQIPTSKEINDILFQSSPISDDFIRGLAKHCAEVSRFISSSIPRPLTETVFDSLNQCKHFEVFQLMEQQNLLETVENFFKEYPAESQTKDAAMLLTSQALSQSILAKYSKELKVNLESAGTELRELKRNLKNRDEYLDKLVERERKMREILDSIFKSDENADLIKVLEAAMKYLQKKTEEGETIFQQKCEYEKKIECLTQAQSNLSAKIDESTSDLKNEKEKCHTLESEKESLLKQLGEANDDIKIKIEEGKEMLQKANQSFIEEKAKADEKSKKEREIAENEIKKLRAEKSEREKALKKLEASYKEKKKKLELKFSADITKAEDELKQSQERVSSLSEANKSLAYKIKSLSSSLEDLEARISRLRSDCEAEKMRLQKRNCELTIQNDALQKSGEIEKKAEFFIERCSALLGLENLWKEDAKDALQIIESEIERISTFILSDVSKTKNLLQIGSDDQLFPSVSALIFKSNTEEEVKSSNIDVAPLKLSLDKWVDWGRRIAKARRGVEGLTEDQIRLFIEEDLFSSKPDACFNKLSLLRCEKSLMMSHSISDLQMKPKALTSMVPIIRCFEFVAKILKADNIPSRKEPQENAPKKRPLIPLLL